MSISKTDTFQRKVLRGTCGVCGIHNRQIESEFSGGLYYGKVCDTCWYQAHPDSVILPRERRNVDLTKSTRPKYDELFITYQMYYLDKNDKCCEFGQLVRDLVTSHYMALWR